MGTVMPGSPHWGTWARVPSTIAPIFIRCNSWDQVLIAHKRSFSTAKHNSARRVVLQHLVVTKKLGKPNFLTKDTKISKWKPNFDVFILNSSHQGPLIKRKPSNHNKNYKTNVFLNKIMSNSQNSYIWYLFPSKPWENKTFKNWIYAWTS